MDIRFPFFQLSTSSGHKLRSGMENRLAITSSSSHPPDECLDFMRLLYRLNTLNPGEILDPQGRGGGVVPDWHTLIGPSSHQQSPSGHIRASRNPSEGTFCWTLNRFLQPYCASSHSVNVHIFKSWEETSPCHWCCPLGRNLSPSPRHIYNFQKEQQLHSSQWRSQRR